ncbi:hypothetical protein AVEN_275123-1 [Araneus ventricosus]|uniref:Uncharacterized protein n=1 Tax=Araneus ventricosus TaxID=182803 RepID=A0A4Y1ZUK9_ARAVE|nr:hypothetical protein AVEN_275123-1 [Araneus ventricosus]
MKIVLWSSEHNCRSASNFGRKQKRKKPVYVLASVHVDMIAQKYNELDDEIRHVTLSPELQFLSNSGANPLTIYLSEYPCVC